MVSSEEPLVDCSCGVAHGDGLEDEGPRTHRLRSREGRSEALWQRQDEAYGREAPADPGGRTAGYRRRHDDRHVAHRGGLGHQVPERRLQELLQMMPVAIGFDLVPGFVRKGLFLASPSKGVSADKGQREEDGDELREVERARHVFCYGGFRNSRHRDVRHAA